MEEIKYYVMRHADYYDFQNQFVTYEGMLKLKRSVDVLKNELPGFSGRKVRIIHSMLPRAVNTALLVKELLFGIKVSLKEDSLLNSDKLCLNEEYIKDKITYCYKVGEICIFITHAPDIEFFCRNNLDNSEYLAMSMSLDIKPFIGKDDNPDDLPF